MSVLPQPAREMRKRRKQTSISSATLPKLMRSEAVADVGMTEEDEATLRNSQEDMTLFSETIQTTKGLMEEILHLKIRNDKEAKSEIASKKMQVSMLYIVLKKLNRLDKFRCQKATELIQETMLKVDNIHLQLQNLHYEAVHLKKEITKCLEFKSLDEDINLVPVEEFHEEAPESISHSAETKKDSHQLMLARLQWELQQRKELARKLSESKNKQEKVLLESSKKQSYLENLRPTLKSILKAAQPLKDELGVPLLASESFHKMAKYLPQPLCILFVQSSAYMESCDQQLQVIVEGDVDEAINWKETEDEIDEDSDSDQEENGKSKRRRRSTFHKMENRRKKLLQKHPLHVKITISCSNDKSISLKFYYLVSLHIVTVETSVSSSLLNISKSGDVMSPSTLLDNLFPGDTGNETPNPANHYQLKKLSMSQFSDYIPEIGRPYLWVQRICGFTFITTSDNMGLNSPLKKELSNSAQHSISSGNIEITIGAIRSRFLTRIALQHQLAGLEKGRIPVSETCAHLFCGKIIGRLTSWKSIDWAKFSTQLGASQLLENDVISKADLIYSATFERSSAKMTAFIFFSPDYPKTVPFFILSINWQGAHSSFNDTHIRDMEKEVNIHWEELVSDCPLDQILVNQLERLRMCFDIYLETAAVQASGVSEGPCEFTKEKIFIQAARGKDHSRPYKFIPKIGIFTHR